MLYREPDPRRPGIILVTPDARSVHLEKRAEGDAETERIVGHGVVYEQVTELFPGYLEVIHKGAGAKTLKEADVRGLFNHSPDYVLGRTKSKTLALREDGEGLAYEIDPPTTRTIEDLVLEPMRRGDLDGSSFAFRATREDEETLENGATLRHIREFELYDVSVVTFPAYEGAGAGLRTQLRNAISVGRAARDDLGRILRASGLTAAEIRATMESVIEDLGKDEPPTGAPPTRGLDTLRRRLDLAALEV